jgi:protein-disulfide isomerase
MRRLFALAVIVIGLLTLDALAGFAQPSDDLRNLRKEVDALKEGQKAIQGDLQEIKNLLRARPTVAAPAAPPQEAALSVDGAPFKGEKNAKVTLVDFTDYQ